MTISIQTSLPVAQSANAVVRCLEALRLESLPTHPDVSKAYVPKNDPDSDNISYVLATYVEAISSNNTNGAGFLYRDYNSDENMWNVQLQLDDHGTQLELQPVRRDGVSKFIITVRGLVPDDENSVDFFTMLKQVIDDFIDDVLAAVAQESGVLIA